MDRKCDCYTLVRTVKRHYVRGDWVPHLALQEEEDGGFEEGGVEALPAPPLGHAVLFSIPMTEEPAERHDTTNTANQQNSLTTQ